MRRRNNFCETVLQDAVANACDDSAPRCTLEITRHMWSFTPPRKRRNFTAVATQCRGRLCSWIQDRINFCRKRTLAQLAMPLERGCLDDETEATSIALGKQTQEFAMIVSPRVDVEAERIRRRTNQTGEPSNP
jgi:hypothetical protein